MIALLRSRAVHRTAIAVVLLVVVITAQTAAPIGAQPSPDGCDPVEPVACLALPEEQASTAESPSAAATTPRPPLPCPPGAAELTIAAPIVPPTACERRAVVATVNRANVLFAQALRSVDASALPEAWSGDALLQVRDYVARLRAGGRYATPELRSIELTELQSDGGRAFVRTLEHWLYQERDRLSGRVVLQEDQWVVNEYELRWERFSWVVVRDVIYTAPPPQPRPARPPCIAIYPPPPGCE